MIKKNRIQKINKKLEQLHKYLLREISLFLTFTERANASRINKAIKFKMNFQLNFLRIFQAVKSLFHVKNYFAANKFHNYNKKYTTLELIKIKFPDIQKATIIEIFADFYNEKVKAQTIQIFEPLDDYIEFTKRLNKNKFTIQANKEILNFLQDASNFIDNRTSPISDFFRNQPVISIGSVPETDFIKIFLEKNLRVRIDSLTVNESVLKEDIYILIEYFQRNPNTLLNIRFDELTNQTAQIIVSNILSLKSVEYPFNIIEKNFDLWSQYIIPIDAKLDIDVNNNEAKNSYIDIVSKNELPPIDKLEVYTEKAHDKFLKHLFSDHIQHLSRVSFHCDYKYALEFLDELNNEHNTESINSIILHNIAGFNPNRRRFRRRNRGAVNFDGILRRFKDLKNFEFVATQSHKSEKKLEIPGIFKHKGMFPFNINRSKNFLANILENNIRSDPNTFNAEKFPGIKLVIDDVAKFKHYLNFLKENSIFRDQVIRNIKVLKLTYFDELIPLEQLIAMREKNNFDNNIIEKTTNDSDTDNANNITADTVKTRRQCKINKINDNNIDDNYNNNIDKNISIGKKSLRSNTRKLATDNQNNIEKKDTKNELKKDKTKTKTKKTKRRKKAKNKRTKSAKNDKKTKTNKNKQDIISETFKIDKIEHLTILNLTQIFEFNQYFTVKNFECLKLLSGFDTKLGSTERDFLSKFKILQISNDKYGYLLSTISRYPDTFKNLNALIIKDKMIYSDISHVKLQNIINLPNLFTLDIKIANHKSMEKELKTDLERVPGVYFQKTATQTRKSK